MGRVESLVPLFQSTFQSGVGEERLVVTITAGGMFVSVTMASQHSESA